LVAGAAALRAARGEPLAVVPAADLLAHRGVGDAERQQALRADRRLDLFVGDELRRPAELAALADASGIEDRHRLAAAALHGAALGLPAAVLLGDLAQRADEIEFFDRAARCHLVRGFGAAERAHQLLLARVPFGLRAAGRAGMFLERDGRQLFRQVFVQRGALDPPGRSDLLPRQLARLEDREDVPLGDLE